MTKTACVFVLLMAWSTSGSAQRWSSEQQELIAAVKRCNIQTACPETAGAM